MSIGAVGLRASRRLGPPGQHMSVPSVWVRRATSGEETRQLIGGSASGWMDPYDQDS